MDSRLIPLQGVLNFRDFGGYATACGSRIKRGRLYRSAHHHKATQADLEAIASLDVRVIVDLRRPSERRREPSKRPVDFTGRVIENDLGDTADDPWWSFVRDSDLSEAAFRGYLVDYYRGAAFEPHHVDLFARYFRALGDTDGAVLIHCAAGKDRTGLLAALTHHLLGVAKDDLIEDYLLTNRALDLEDRLPGMIEIIAEYTGREPTPQAARLVMSVEAAYLHTALSAIEAAYGGLDAYLEAVLGVDDALRERVKRRLLD